MSCNLFRVARYLSVAVVVVITSVVTAQGFELGRAQQSDSPLTLQPTENGFNGVYLLNGQAYKIENRVIDDTFLTRIFRPDGTLLVESVKEAGTVSVVLPTGKVVIDVASPKGFSDEATTIIREFNQSNDRALVKQIVIEVFRKRTGEKPSFLAGFRVISMLLGE